MPNLKSPIFVVGNVHSGTTLMQGIIGRHPSVFCGRGETRFFYHLVGIQRRYPDLTNAATRQKFIEFGLRTISAGYGTVKDADEAGQSIDLIKYGITMTDLEELQKRLAGVGNHDRAYVMIYDFLSEKMGACRRLEKTPTHLLFAARILAVAPQARFVEVVRDPRAILASKHKRRTGQALEANGSKRFHRGVDPVLDSLGWCSMVKAGDHVAAKWPDRILRIRYEDLTADPEGTTRGVCRFLNLDFDPSLLDVAWTNSTTTGHQTRGIGTAAVERWKTDLEPSAALVCQFMLRREMACLDYRPLTYSLATRFGALKWAGRSVAELPRLLYTRWRIGGIVQLRNLFAVYANRLRHLVNTNSPV